MHEYSHTSARINVPSPPNIAEYVLLLTYTANISEKPYQPTDDITAPGSCANSGRRLLGINLNIKRNASVSSTGKNSHLMSITASMTIAR